MTARDGINYNNKFDIQLTRAQIEERKLRDIFLTEKIERHELKSENHQWEKTQNICIEYLHKGKPSGIAVTEADYWVHQLRRENDTLVYLMFPIDRIKALARDAIKRGRFRHGAGDRGEYSVALVALKDIFK